MAKNDGSLRELLLILFIVLIIGVAISSSSKTSRSFVLPNTRTWRLYAQKLSKEDIPAQLANSRNLLFALGNDISLLQAQNVEIQAALATVNIQLELAQQQANEDKKRQSVEKWITTIVGTIAGWLLGFVAPARSTLAPIGSFLKGSFKGKINKSQKGLENNNESGVNIQTDVNGGLVATIQRVLLWVFSLWFGGLSIYFVVEKLTLQREDEFTDRLLLVFASILILLWLARYLLAHPGIVIASVIGLLSLIWGGPFLHSEWNDQIINPLVVTAFGGLLGGLAGWQIERNRTISKPKWEFGLAVVGLIFGFVIGFFIYAASIG